MAVVAVLRLLAHDALMLLVWLNAFSFYVYLPVYVLAPPAVWRRRWCWSGFCAVLAGCHLVWVLPDFRFAAALPPGVEDAPGLKVFSANVYCFNRTPQCILDEITAAEPDVIFLQEYSDVWREALKTAGLFEQYPHTLLEPQNHSFGIAVLSRLPLEDASILRPADLPVVRATVTVGRRRLRLYNWHPPPPITKGLVGRWNAMYEALVLMLADEPDPVAVIGDFNATQHSGWMKRLAGRQFRSAHGLRGRGWAVTYPNGTRLLPPVRLDHALLSPGVVCLGIREGTGAGSDHRPLIVELAVLPR